MLEKHVQKYENFEDVVEALCKEPPQTVYIFDKLHIVLMKYEDYRDLNPSEE